MGKLQIVVVDDDLAARNTVKGYLTDHPLYRVAADFQDGHTALAWLRQNSIDILLCDMQMPNMDGTELMRLVRVFMPDVVMIAISSFDDFQYTRGCLVEGAADYLLKHDLTKERLLSVLDTVRQRYRLQAGRQDAKYRVGCCLDQPGDFQAERICQMIDSHEIVFDKKGLLAMVISPDYRCLPNADYRQMRQDTCSAVCDMIAQILGAEYPYIYCLTSRRHIWLMISFLRENSMLFVLNCVNNFCTRLRRTAFRLLDTTLTIGIGTPRQELTDALEEIRALERGMEAKLYLGGDRFYRLDANPTCPSGNVTIPQRLWSSLAFAIDQADLSAARTTVDEMCRFFRENHAGCKDVQGMIHQMLSLFLEKGLCPSSRRNDLLTHLSEMETLEQLSAVVNGLLSEHLRHTPSPPATSVPIQQVQEYIRHNFSQDISLQDCADHAGISYTHLSRVFRQETGCRFVEYLNRIRLDHAKALLIRQDLSMKQIVEQTGFRNYNYFFKVFRENEGMTPSEFVTKKCSKP